MPITERATSPAILLVDNGSLAPAATFSLRAIAGQLATALGRRVDPISLLHSSSIPAGQLGGSAAEILEPALERRIREGVEDFLVVPLFFGPSSALADYLPRRIAALKEKFPRVRVRVAAPLVDPADRGDERIAAILEENVRALLANASELAGKRAAPAVVLVDHGSPTRAVVAVRDHVTAQLRHRLGPAVRGVLAASMERRSGAEFDFSGPLLADAFARPGFDAGPVIVAMLFLSPGRHAGPDGDVAQICTAARQHHPELRPLITALVGSHPGLIPVLVDRVASVLNST